MDSQKKIKKSSSSSKSSDKKNNSSTSSIKLNASKLDTKSSTKDAQTSDSKKNVVPVKTFKLSPVNAGLTATGTTQSTALILICEYNKITTVPLGSGVILDNGSYKGMKVGVKNTALLSLNVYPQKTGEIDSLGIDTPFVLSGGSTCLMICTDGTNWESW